MAIPDRAARLLVVASLAISCAAAAPAGQQAAALALAVPQAAPAPTQRHPHDIVVDAPRGDLRAECARRRLALAARLGPGVFLLDAQDGANLQHFFQEDNFYYLSGVEIPDIALALRIDAAGGLVDEVLFLPAHDPDFEIWNGKRLAPGPDAEAATGFRRTAGLNEVEAVLAGWAADKTAYTVGTPRSELPADMLLDSTRAAQELGALRLRKSQYEIDCLKAAIDITCAALLDAADEVRPGAFEYQPQGALEGAFLRLGAERPGFASIFGSGPNSVTLHYNANRRQMQDGDLIVMDVGAKSRYYCADVTRTVPVNGRFTPRQRQVYDLVLAAQTAAFEAAKPGVTMRQLDAIARKLIVDGGFGPDRAYFQHSLGHWIGLDVHDVGGGVPIEAGMLFTIEPGIYIAEENLGVRIEDDYLMTEDGAVKLSTGITSDPAQIEALLRR